jgi:hypothetical protein
VLFAEDPSISLIPHFLESRRVRDTAALRLVVDPDDIFEWTVANKRGGEWRYDKF